MECISNLHSLFWLFFVFFVTFVVHPDFPRTFESLTEPP